MFYNIILLIYCFHSHFYSKTTNERTATNRKWVQRSCVFSTQLIKLIHYQNVSIDPFDYFHVSKGNAINTTNPSYIIH